MDSETSLIIELLGAVGGFSFLMLYATTRILTLRGAAPDRRFEAARAKLPVGEPPISMPVHLTSREEMVGWMINDLPKLTARMIQADRASSR